MIYKFYNFIVDSFNSLSQMQAMIFAYGFLFLILFPLPLWATLSSHIAGRKGRSPGGWFMIAIFLSFITPILLLCLKSRANFIKPSKCLYNWTCPACWHSNDEHSKVCEKCGAEMPKIHAE